MENQFKFVRINGLLMKFLVSCHPSCLCQFTKLWMRCSILLLVNGMMIHLRLSSHLADKILSIPVGNCEDFTILKVTLTRLNDLHTTWLGLQGGLRHYPMCATKHWKMLWSIKAPSKMKIILWCLVHDRLPTIFQLQLAQYRKPRICQRQKVCRQPPVGIRRAKPTVRGKPLANPGRRQSSGYAVGDRGHTFCCLESVEHCFLTCHFASAV